jgi:ribosomal protein S18 acetylase RimI-like enzyme
MLGMKTVSICVESDNDAAENLYEAMGFHKIFEIRTYVKKVL